MRLFLTIFCIALSCSLQFGCLVVDNQLKIPPERLPSVNPIPVLNVEQIRQSNANHKVIVAVLDTGTDYNHRFLRDNIHYRIGKGHIYGTGFDYIANDKWPAPHVARTEDVDQSVPAEDRAMAIKGRLILEKIVAKNPALQRYLNPHRRVMFETMYPVYHGTHVSGLITQQNKKIGLIPYRLLMQNRRYDEYGMTTYDSSDDDLIIENITDAVNDAAFQGARIINFSGGLTSNSDYATEKEQREFQARIERVRAAINRHKNILFVAAIPNEAAVFNDKNLNLPCGAIEAENLLCVGMLDETGKLHSSTARLPGYHNLLYIHGENILSSAPEDFCYSGFSIGLLSRLSQSNGASEQELAQFTRLCNRQEQAASNSRLGNMIRATGSSFSAPQVAHLAARQLLISPEYTPMQLIDRLLRMTRKRHNQKFDYYYRALPVRQKTWQMTAEEHFGSFRKKTYVNETPGP